MTKNYFKVFNLCFQVSWLLVWFAQDVYYLYAARLLAGFFSGGSYLMVSLFLSEIASDRYHITILNKCAVKFHVHMKNTFQCSRYTNFNTNLRRRYWNIIGIYYSQLFQFLCHSEICNRINDNSRRFILFLAWNTTIPIETEKNCRKYNFIHILNSDTFTTNSNRQQKSQFDFIRICDKQITIAKYLSLKSIN